ncbi:MAG: adenylate/guanylate cyclase domain-containing protein [Leptospirales bacterium]|nr:adenylate/guanylate cyclase domain-containing protein [Leptospirales bacterium]
MKDDIFKQIIRRREIQNEKVVAIARFTCIGVAMCFDIMAHFHIIHFTAVVPTGTTLVLDLLFVVASGTILLYVLKFPYWPFLKFVTITSDFFFAGMMVRFDPTIPKEGDLVPWIATVAAIFLYTYNLLRFSRAGTLYAAFLAVIFFLAFGLTAGQNRTSELLPLLMGLLMTLGIGYSITLANLKMMKEADSKRMMERFLPPQLVNEIYTEQESFSPGGKSQEVTIVFSDIRSFTQISESMQPSDVVLMLNDYLSAMTDVIFSHTGTIDKFIGDAIMTVYGAPRSAPDDAARAVHTALDMLDAAKEVNARHPALPQPLKIGIGIHTGEVIVGNIGSEKRLDYTVIGDNVNLASRIEGLTKYFGCSVLVSDATVAALIAADKAGQFIFRKIGSARVKGKSHSIVVHELMGSASPENSALLSLKHEFEDGVESYLQRDFAHALSIFLKHPGDSPSRVYAERCRVFQLNPPAPAWDGVHDMLNK